MQVYTQDPYSWNYVMNKAKREKKAERIELRKVASLPGPEQAKMSLNAKLVAQFLGIDVAREWSVYYDKVWHLTEWAKIKTGSKEINTLIDFLKDKFNQTPSMNARKIDDLYVSYKLDSSRDLPEEKKLTEEEPKEDQEVNETNEEKADNLTE